MLEEMTKLRIIAPRRLMPRVIQEMYALQALHITEEHAALEAGKPLATAEQISEALVKAQSVGSYLKIEPPETAKNAEVRQAIKEVTQLAPKIQKSIDSIKHADQQLKELAAYLEKQALLNRLSITKESLDEYGSIASFIGSIKDADEFERQLTSKTPKYLLKKALTEKTTYIALFIEKPKAEEAKNLLSSNGFSPISFEGIPGYDLKKAETKAMRQKKSAEAELSKEKKRCNTLLPRYQNALIEALDKAEAPLRFRETEETTIISGFIPAERIVEVTIALEKVTSNRIYIESAKPGHHDKVPVELRNIDPVKNFKFFLDLYSLPKYKEIDPSWFLFLTFPLFFGFMLGDWGYGLTTLALFWLLKRKMRQFSAFFNILLFSSWATIVFGIIFGEFFGLEFYHPLVSRNPENSLVPLMVIAIIIGVIHINVGIIAGFINELKSHGFKKALLAKASWILLELGVAVLALSHFHLLLVRASVGYGMILLAAVMLFFGEVVAGLVEIPGIFGNILSYMRLMAIGLSSVGLALVVNDLAGGFFHAGGLKIIAGVIILIIGHIINLTIGCLGSFLHSLRLHYVELFTKFYHGGGIPFKPFGMRTKG